jgi:uncharacterized protein
MNSVLMHISSISSVVDWRWARLILAAFIAGILNAVAGGGSFLSFPAILGMGVLPVQANATNTVALWPGQLTSVAAYWSDVRSNLHIAWPMGVAGLIGGTAGSIVLLNTPQKTFLHLVPWLLLCATGLFAISGPVTRAMERLNLARMHDSESGHPHQPKRIPLFLATIAVSFYIGYFGAGAGFLIITLLALFGYQDINTINALKVVANLLANGVAFAIFVIDGQVVWRYCLASMVAAAIGGYYSASLGRRVPRDVMRAMVVMIGITMAIWYFWKNSL